MGDAGRRAAGSAAAELVEPGMRLGYGTGSTVEHFLVALAGRRLDVAGIATSQATAERCRQLGLALLDPAEVVELDLTVDGADELDRWLNLTKGGGAALLREKVVAGMSARLVVIATADKLVERLGVSFPLPIEVVPFAVGPVQRELERRGGQPVERWRAGAAVRTDNGNALLDTTWPGGIDDPAALELELAMVPGIVESGLFVGRASLALLGTEDGRIQEHHRPR